MPSFLCFPWANDQPFPGERADLTWLGDTHCANCNVSIFWRFCPQTTQRACAHKAITITSRSTGGSPAILCKSLMTIIYTECGEGDCGYVSQTLYSRLRHAPQDTETCRYRVYLAYAPRRYSIFQTATAGNGRHRQAPAASGTTLYYAVCIMIPLWTAIVPGLSQPLCEGSALRIRWRILPNEPDQPVGLASGHQQRSTLRCCRSAAVAAPLGADFPPLNRSVEMDIFPRFRSQRQLSADFISALPSAASLQTVTGGF